MALASDDPNVIYGNFSVIFNACFNKYFPLATKRIKSNHFNKPNITPDFKSKIREKNKLAKIYAKHPITYGEEYHRLRNQVTLAIRTAKANYMKDKLEQHSGNSKKTWQIINSALGGQIYSKLRDTFIQDNFKLNRSDVIAEHFNSYFINAGKHLAEKSLTYKSSLFRTPSKLK